MKKFIIFILAVIFLRAEDLQVRYSYSPDSGDILPTIKMPIYWDSKKMFFSSILYRSNSYSEKESGELYDKKGIFYNRTEFDLKLIGYRKSKNMEFYTSINRIEIEKNEIGYKDELFFDNIVDIEVNRLRIGGNFGYSFSENLSSTFSADIFPVSKLNIEQNTVLKPLSKKVGENSSSNDLDPSFQLSLNLKYSFSKNWKSELSYRYSYIPLEYETLNFQNSRFTKSRISETDIERAIFLEILTPIKILNIGNLSFGIGRIESKNLFTIGFKESI
jgi:hypothetical protein